MPTIISKQSKQSVPAFPINSALFNEFMSIERPQSINLIIGTLIQSLADIPSFKKLKNHLIIVINITLK